VVPASALTAAPSPSIPSACLGTGCSSSIPLVTSGTSGTSGTGVGPEPSLTSRGPFANSTDGSLAPGPTSTGTGRVSGTGISSVDANSTTIVHSTVTRSVTTFTDSPFWSVWTNGPGATGTGPSSVFSAFPTTSGPFSNLSSPLPIATLTNSTFVSAGQTFTTQVPVTSQSYISTATYAFSGTTIEIPIPDSYTRRLPDADLSATTSPSQASAPSITTVSQSNGITEISTSTCRTTTNFVSTGTGVTATIAHSTLICWGIECIDHVCHDFVDWTPLTVDATASSAGPFINSTSPTSISASPTGTGLIYATDETGPARPTSRPSSVWPSSNNTGNPEAYTNTRSVITPTAAQILTAAATAEEMYTFTATDSAGNAFTTTYSGELPTPWVNAPSDSSALVFGLSSASVAATATMSTALTFNTTGVAAPTFAWAAWSSKLSASTTPTSASASVLGTPFSTVDTDTDTDTIEARSLSSAEASINAGVLAMHGGESQRRRAGIKAVRAERKKQVNDFGLEKRAAEVKRMEMDVVGLDHQGNEDVAVVECNRIRCWLWR